MGRPDPRVDPVSEPPVKPSDLTVDEVRRLLAGEPPAPPPTSASAGDGAIELAAPTRSTASAAPEPPSQVTSRDPRYEALEKLLDRNDWQGIKTELGPLEDLGKLPPNLGLVAALAHNETAKDANPEAIAVAIRCMAGLLGVAEDSPLARVLARRMLRKNPVRFVDRQAPPARVSLLIVVLTLVVGGGVGWLLSSGSWNAIARMLHLG